MKRKSFEKTLSANDVGATGSHQAGILVPKSDQDLLSFFPKLDPTILNPDAWIACIDEDGEEWKLRFVYYNNKLHRSTGTRNEYRLTYLTSYFGHTAAREGDVLTFTATSVAKRYLISINRSHVGSLGTSAAPVIRLTGWRQAH